MFRDKSVEKAIKKILNKSEAGIVDMELVEYICTLRQSGMSNTSFKDVLINLFREYNRDKEDE